MRSLVVDNGSHAIKCGYADQPEALAIPNTITRTKRTKQVYVGDLMDRSTDISGLHFRSPFDRGCLVRWDVQLAIWDRMLSDALLACQPGGTSLVVTEPMFNFREIQSAMDEIVYEEYQFESLVRAPAARLCALDDSEAECCLVVDVGHSGTWAAPYLKNKAIKDAVRRTDVGGRMLTNYLKETVSFRHWDMMDETYIMGAVKEQCCFVSQQFWPDLESPCRLDYVLPDFKHTKRGFVRGRQTELEQRMEDKVQLLRLGNERFCVPEALFYPSDVGLVEQGGIHRAVVQAAMSCEEQLRGVLLSNIVLVGGSATLPGLRERLQAEVQAMVPPACRVQIRVPENPASAAWSGGCKISEDSEWRVGRQQYLEMGAERTVAHFSSYM